MMTTNPIEPLHSGSVHAMAAAPPRGWWARNWKWAVPSGVVLMVGAIVAFLLIIFACIVGMLRGTEVYVTAMTEARRDPAVVAALGVPIEEGGLLQGNIEMTPNSGYADLAIPIEGPAGSGTIYVIAEKSGDEWSYETLEVAVHASAETIDLLEDW